MTIDYHGRFTGTITGRIGVDHPDTLVARGTLTHWRGEAGDAVGAAAAYAELTEDRLHIHGPGVRGPILRAQTGA